MDLMHQQKEETNDNRPMPGNEADNKTTERNDLASLAPTTQASPTETPQTGTSVVMSGLDCKKQQEMPVQGPQPQTMSQISLPEKRTGPVKAKATEKKRGQTLAPPALKPAPLTPLCVQRPLLPGWIQAFDPATRLPYYFHPPTLTSQWQPPLAPQQPLPPPWVEAIDPARGIPYYHNPAIGASQWERPIAFPLAPTSVGLPWAGLPSALSPVIAQAGSVDAAAAPLHFHNNLRLPASGPPRAPIVTAVPNFNPTAVSNPEAFPQVVATSTASPAPSLSAALTLPNLKPTAISSPKGDPQTVTSATASPVPSQSAAPTLPAKVEAPDDEAVEASPAKPTPAEPLPKPEHADQTLVAEAVTAPAAASKEKAVRKKTKKGTKAGGEALVMSVADLPNLCMECGCLGLVSSHGVCFPCSTSPSTSPPATAAANLLLEAPPPAKRPKRQKRAKPPVYHPPPARASEKDSGDAPSDGYLPQELLEMIVKRVAVAKPRTKPRWRCDDLYSYEWYLSRSDPEPDLRVDHRLIMRDLANLSAVSKDWARGVESVGWATLLACISPGAGDVSGGSASKGDVSGALAALLFSITGTGDVSGGSVSKGDLSGGIADAVDVSGGITGKGDISGGSADEGDVSGGAPSAVETLKKMHAENATIAATRAAAEYKVKKEELYAQAKPYKVKQNPHRRSAKMRIYYVKDVLNVALAKHGGACGLRRKLEKCEETARKRAANAAGKPPKNQYVIVARDQPWPPWDSDDSDSYYW